MSRCSEVGSALGTLMLSESEVSGGTAFLEPGRGGPVGASDDLEVLKVEGSLNEHLDASAKEHAPAGLTVEAGFPVTCPGRLDGCGIEGGQVCRDRGTLLKSGRRDERERTGKKKRKCGSLQLAISFKRNDTRGAGRKIWSECSRRVRFFGNYNDRQLKGGRVTLRAAIQPTSRRSGRMVCYPEIVSQLRSQR